MLFYLICVNLLYHPNRIHTNQVSQQHKGILYYFLVAGFGFFWRLNSTVNIG
jgi:hypothetical protein